MGRGRLVFKGDEKPKKKKKKSKHHHHDKKHAAASATADTQEAAAVAISHARVERPSEAAAAAAVADTGPKIQEGKGEITTSGTVVTGHDTHFTRQIRTGDALLVQINGTDEMRVVTMRLSDTSINLSSAFSQNLSTPTSFRFIAKPGSNKAQESKKKPPPIRHGEGDDHVADSNDDGTADHRELVYRERTEHGSYRIKKVQLDRDVTRGTLLEMRAKKKSDKYC